MKRYRFIGSQVASAASVLFTGIKTGAAEQRVPGGTELVERRADFDLSGFDRTLGRPAECRLLWESVAFVPTFFNNVKNSINGLQFGYGVDPAQIVTVIAGHGPSSAYGYTDYLWQRYRIREPQPNT